MRAPKISVVIAVHNGERFLEACLASLTAQSFTDFEIVVIDDGSDDGTAALAQSHQRRDDRLRVFTNPKNKGLACSLNSGLDAARGDFIARLDADDQCLPERFARQHAAFNANPNLVLLGSNVAYCDAAGRLIQYSDFPHDDATIRAWCLLQNPFSHPAVMIRRAILEKYSLRYDPTFETTQDWEFWTRILPHGQVRNLPEPLVRQTVHAHSISLRKKNIQISNSTLLQTRQAEALIGLPLCSTSAYKLINEAFLAGREEADMLGLDRITACHTALDALDKLATIAPGLITPGFHRWILERCLRIGLMPPFTKGWLRLFKRLITQHSNFLGPSMVKLAKRKLIGKAFA